MGLLRNARGLIIPSVVHPHLQGRADDPEFHISRLNHFGQGMGIDLASTASTHPQFSAKWLISNDSMENENLEFNSHDEGLDLTKGHILAASKVSSNMAGYDRLSMRDRSLNNYATNELQHRAPYQHRVAASIPEVPEDDFHLDESIHKDIADDKSLDYLSSSWNVPRRNRTQGYNPNFDTHKDAMKDIRSRFEEFNRNRQRPSEDVYTIVNRAINNPDPDRMSMARRKAPNNLSSQFLGVYYNTSGENPRDQIDLKTGTWAKIDPEGYFPD